MKTKKLFLLLAILSSIFIVALVLMSHTPRSEITPFGATQASPDGKHFASALYMKSEIEGKMFESWFEVQLGSYGRGIEHVWSFPKKLGRPEQYRMDEFHVEWSDNSKQLRVSMPDVTLNLDL